MSFSVAITPIDLLSDQALTTRNNWRSEFVHVCAEFYNDIGSNSLLCVPRRHQAQRLHVTYYISQALSRIDYYFLTKG